MLIPACYFCRLPIPTKNRVGRNDTCEKCGKDLHSCVNCRFYDSNAHNSCKEPQSSWVTDRTKSNFCEYYTPGGNRVDKKQLDARAKLEALFKK